MEENLNRKKMRCFPSTDFIAIQKAKQEKKKS